MLNKIDPGWLAVWVLLGSLFVYGSLITLRNPLSYSERGLVYDPHAQHQEDDRDSEMADR